MSASNGGPLSEEEKTFFNTTQRHFPSVVDGQINTCQFLESSKDVVFLIGQFGTIFTPVIYDMNGNIEKITKRYDTDPLKHVWLNELILIEKSEGGNFSIDALLWLRRALCFIHTFFKCILEDFKEGKKTEKLDVFLQKAYVETLEKHHNWVARKMFSVICHMCPTRTTLMQILSLGHPHREDAVFRSMPLFLDTMQANMTILYDLYDKNQLEPVAKA